MFDVVSFASLCIFGNFESCEFARLGRFHTEYLQPREVSIPI